MYAHGHFYIDKIDSVSEFITTRYDWNGILAKLACLHSQFFFSF